MAIPDYETLMLPILEFISDNQERKTSEIVSFIAERFHLSDEDMRTLIPSGRGKLIHNRVGWACTHLRKAGLVTSRQRGLNQITADGQKALEKKPQKIDKNFLSQFEKFHDFASEASSIKYPVYEDDSIGKPEEKTPEEIIGIQKEIIHDSIKKDLVENVWELDSDFFEQLVVDLLVAMGYGGSVEDAGRAIGRANDGGIDGVIKEDVLGLDTIFIQAKRWKNTVPIKEVRDFAGALLSKKSNKGVFITSSQFPASAHDFVSSIDRKIILIDGERLANLMIKFNIGVSTKQIIEIKEIDSDYFAS